MILHSESDLPVHEEVLDASGDPLCVYGDVSSLGNEIFIESSPGPSRYLFPISNICLSLFLVFGTKKILSMSMNVFSF